MSWSDPCGECGSSRADCNCNEFASVKKIKVHQPFEVDPTLESEHVIVYFDHDSNQLIGCVREK